MSAENNEWLTAAVRNEIAYEVIGNTDTTEGAGRPYTIGVCSNMAAAKTLARGKGVMGTPAKVREAAFLRVKFHDLDGNEEDLYVVKSTDAVDVYDPEEEERKRALSKLTEREKSLLGL